MDYRYSTMSTNRLRTLLCLALVALCTLAAWPAHAQVSGLKNLPAFTNTPHQVREGSAALVGAYNPASKLRLAFSIKAPKMAEEEAFLKQLQDKTSPNYHKWLTPAQWNARFAPSVDDEQAVVDWATSQGLTVTARYPNRLMVNVEGTVDTIQKAFNIKINHYQVNGQVEFSNDRDPEIPENLQSIVQYVDGLNSIVRMRPANSAMKGIRGPDYSPGPVRQINSALHWDATAPAPKELGKTEQFKGAGQITGGFYDPTDFYSQEAYNYNGLQALGHCCNPFHTSGHDGGGPVETSIGLATDGDFLDSDVVGFHNQYPYLAGFYYHVFVNGTPSCCSDESTLDLEWSLATSNSFGAGTDTAQIYNYEAAQGFGDFGTVFQQMLNDNLVRVVNISYGLSETIFIEDAPGLLSSWHSIFNQMIGQGWTIMAASGDSGSDAGCTGALAVLYPESDPDVTSVGGTQLELNSDGSFNTEVAWTGDTFSGACSENDGGGGGGCSAVWAAPGYQVNPYCGSSSRSVPDVALHASPHPYTNFYFEGALNGVAGTSLASPLMSGFIAQVDAYSLSMGNACGSGTRNCAPIGQVDYDIYAEGGYNMSAPHYPFYDITSGCTSNDTISSAWCATSGYDLATGWGSFNALQMAWAINWEDNLAYAAPSVSFSGPATNTWYNSDKTVSWSVNANSNPTGIAGFTQGWDSIPSDPFSDTNRNHSNSFFSGPQFPNATTGCLELAGGSCAGGVSQGCHTAHVRAWSNQGSTSGDVTYGPICYDTMSSVTSASLSGTLVSGSNYKSAVKVTLTATDPGAPTTGSGVASTVYQVNSEGQHTYSAPFTVSYPGSYTVTFHSTDVAGNVESTKAVSFTITSILTMSPASLGFGNQPIGTASTSKTVTLKNISAAAVPLTSITPSGDFSVPSKTCGASLAAGASCTVNVTFKPTVTGAVSGDVTVTFPGEGSPQRLGMSGTGQNPITLSPASLAFGSIAVGSTSAAKTVTLTNNESTSLNISRAATSDYSISSTTCAATLASKASCTMSVTFHPKQNGNVEGAVAVSYNGSLSPQEVTLSGSGTGGAASPLSFTPSLLSFGNVAAGTTLSKTVTVKNTSASSVKISAVAAGGDYTVTGCVTTLASLGTCTLTVNFKPSVKGTVYGSVGLTDNTGVSPETFEVTGVGVTPLGASLSALNFGTVTVGTTSTSKSVTLTNNLASALSLSIAVSGDFAHAGGTCGASLAAHASCTLLVNFTPTATGAINGVVTITYPSTYSPEEVTLTGTGN